MSTQAYYKDRLGFDPREALYDTATGVKTTTKTSSTTLTQQSRSSGGGVGVNVIRGGSSKETHNSSYHQQHQQHHHSHSHQQQHHNQDYSDSPAVKKQKQDGYEDALTQFKGTMSCWDFFVENWDVLGKIGIIFLFKTTHNKTTNCVFSSDECPRWNGLIKLTFFLFY